MNKLKIGISFLCIQILAISTTFAQTTNPDFMQSIGKIYVVVAVIITIFIGIIIYLFSLERKIKNLEQQLLNDER
ncbi:MAG: CcmD family protein [Saprospiraceae bacterium]